MSSEMRYSKIFWFRIFVTLFIFTLAGLFIYWMHHNYTVVDPYNPALEGTARYGRNGEGDFESYLIVTLIEFFVLLIILRPFSFRPEHWLRVLIAFILFGGWSFLLMLGAMHSGGVNMIHLLCMLALDVFLFILLCIAIIALVVESNNRQRALTTPR